jgi:hypothetical protein
VIASLRTRESDDSLRRGIPDTVGPVLQVRYDVGTRLSLPGKYSDFHKRQQT